MAVLVGGLGLLMLAGGAVLLSAGGSPYYLLAGLWLCATAILLARRYGWGLAAYAVFLAVTAVWAVWEVGAVPWLLLPRTAGPAVVMLLLALAAVPVLAGQRRAVRTAMAAGLGLVMLCGGVAAIGHSRHAQAQPPTAAATPAPATGDWPVYGADAAGRRYSPLAQITPQNVSRLQVAWTYRTGERPDPENLKRYRFEATPLKVGDTLYFCTPHNRVIALDAETGQARWTYDPKVPPKAGALRSCRGVSYWAEPEGTPARSCLRRILAPTLDARLLALDADTGRPCEDFGEGGQIDLRAGMGTIPPNGYYVTSPPAIGGDLAVVGGWVLDSYAVDAPPGVIRAFDVRTGRLAWAWDPGRPDQSGPPPAGQTYSRGSPNSWAPATVDEALGLIYLPTGNGTLDHWGGARRPVHERFSSAVVALDLATGKLRWVYQTVHHDLWDLDVPAQPTLVDLKSGGQAVPALFLPTKRGDVFVLDRRTGAPIVPAPEKPVPQHASPGDWSAPTQPFSELSYAPKPLREADMWGISPLDQLWCRIKFARSRYDGAFTPTGLKPVIAYPGSYGVFNWGGAAIDESRGLAVLNATYTAFRLQIAPRSAETMAKSIRPQYGAPYVTIGGPFVSPLGIPCNAPPWGEMIAVDLATMKTAWRKPFGTTRDRALFGISLPLGMPSMGGPVLTGGGLAFIAAASDNYLRAYEATTGREVWKARLPAGGQATPMTYASQASGRQFVVVAAGGHATIGSRTGDYVIAYSLPRTNP
jgi:membrane-bound PQQ-dependent dehydrogenase (glucose/quinate/shikimate family)